MEPHDYRKLLNIPQNQLLHQPMHRSLALIELQLHLQLLDYDRKRLHYFQQMYHKEQGYLAATSEQLALHVDMTTRRAGEFPQHIIDKLDAMSGPHRRLEIPAQVGHQIGIKRK